MTTQKSSVCESENNQHAAAASVSSSASASSSSSRVTKQTGKRDSASASLDAQPRDGTSAKDSSAAQKRRRRAFSCLSCQKLKCRCEFDLGAQGCHRCATLRIVCSLRGQNVATSSPTTAKAEPIVSTTSVEERLRRNEESLDQIKSMIQSLKPNAQVQDAGDAPAAHQHEERRQHGRAQAVDSEYFSSPVDKHAESAPVAVLRQISRQVTLGHPRKLGDMNLDLVQQGLLDSQTASELLELFFRHQSHLLFVRTPDEIRDFGDLRIVSGFLHSVCCVMGVVYHTDICGTLLHRQVYEQVRIMLGQALLSSPLDMDELNALFIMSTNGNTPNSQGCEYIDSWLLTGYCAKQAMLSIQFSKMAARIKKGAATTEDHNTMHLWSTICLHHLHWAATTGRAPVIPESYINQCNFLLSFYQATMQDGMLVAEIMLYSILHQELSRQSLPRDGRECEAFLKWKQRWGHLLALSTSSMLQVGYHAACLILVVRTLEDTGHALGPQSLLSTDNTPVAVPSSTDHDEQPETPLFETHSDSAGNARTGTQEQSSKQPPATAKVAAADMLRANGCKYARQVVETFLEMPSFRKDASPTSTCLCIGYCVLLLAHYDAALSGVPDDVTFSLMTRMDAWMRSSPGKAWSYKYGILARKKMEARLGGARYLGSFGGGEDGDSGHEMQRTSEAEFRGENFSGHVAHGFHAQSNHHNTNNNSNDLLGPSEQTLDVGSEGMPFFELHDQAVFPSMEDFFGGGFLDFMK